MTSAPPPLNLLSHGLFLDFDGTLVEFGPTPDAIEVSSRVHDLLDALHQRLDGALAFVTGRGVENLTHHLKRRDFVVVGGHGAEWMFDGQNVEVMSGESFDSETNAIATFAESDERLVLQRKLGGLTLHFRQAPEREAEVRALFHSTFSKRDDFDVMDGNLMLEARRSGADKGSAIARLMHLSTFANRIPVFLGDDVTDEFGFAEINQRDGLSVRVGAGRTRAKHRLADIEAVLTWLERAL